MPDRLESKRLLALSNLLAQYSLGNFDGPDVELSDKLDEIDSIISGVNMLGQELKATTVSRDFFADIYNSVTNILLVTDTEFNIVDFNRTSNNLLLFEKNELKSKNLLELICPNDRDKLKKTLPKSPIKFRTEISFCKKDGKELFVSFNSIKLFDSQNETKGFLIVAEDISDKRNREREILRRITATQEKERARLANDLHDSIGSDLSYIQGIIAVVSQQMNEEEKFKNNLIECVKMLDSSIKDIRKVCFDLVPSALTKGELLYALKQILERWKEGTKGISFEYDFELFETALEKVKQLAVFRVFQEFVHNSIKHAACTIIKVSVEEEDKFFSLTISDNGKGFEIDSNTLHKGRGLSTMHSRIEALSGRVKLSSVVGQGTKIVIKFPIS